MRAADRQQLRRVPHAPVTELVREDGLDFLCLALVDEGVVDDDLLLPGQAGEVGVAVGAALAAVDDVEGGEGEVEAGGEGFDARFEVAGGEGGEGVEEGDYEEGVEGYGA